MASLHPSAPKYGPALIGTLGLLSMVGPLATDMYLPGFPQVAEHLHASSGAVQLTLSLFMVGMGLGQLVWGPLSDIVGRRGPLVAAGAVFAVASLLAALAPDITWLTVWRFVQGFTGSAGVVIGRAIARDVSGGVELARLFGFIGIVNGLAPVLAPVLGGLLIGLIGWRGVLLVLTGIAALMLVASVLVLGESLPGERRLVGGMRALARSTATVLRDRSFLGFTLSQVFGFGVLFTWISSSSVVLQLLYGLDSTRFALCMAVFAVCTLVAGSLNTRLVRRVAMWRLLIGGLLIDVVMAGALLVVVLAWGGTLPPLWLLLVLACLVGAPFPLIMANSMTLGLARHGRGAGMASAVIGALQYGMAALVSPIVTITGSVSLTTVAVTMAVCALLAALSALVCAPESRSIAGLR